MLFLFRIREYRACVFFEKARELGVFLDGTKQEERLVYGGANIGLMECIAKAAKDNGSMIMGVIPTKLEERGRASDWWM